MKIGSWHGLITLRKNNNERNRIALLCLSDQLSSTLIWSCYSNSNSSSMCIKQLETANKHIFDCRLLVFKQAVVVFISSSIQMDATVIRQTNHKSTKFYCASSNALCILLHHAKGTSTSMLFTHHMNNNDHSHLLYVTRQSSESVASNQA